MTFGARSTELRQNVWHNLWSENNKYFYVIPIWGSQGGNIDTRIFVHENTGSRQSHILHMKNTQNVSRLHVKYAENFPLRLISDFARVERVVSASERRVQRGFQKLPGLHWDLLSSAKFPAGGSTGTWMGEIVESPIGQSITNAWLIHKWLTARFIVEYNSIDRQSMFKMCSGNLDGGNGLLGLIFWHCFNTFPQAISLPHLQWAKNYIYLQPCSKTWQNHVNKPYLS